MATTSTPDTTSTRSRATTRSPWLMLALATAGFAVNFWAWALISPLGVAYREALGLTAFQQSLLVAVPVIVGSLGRIPVGALTDRLGARVMFPAVSFLTILPVLFVGLFGDSRPSDTATFAGYLITTIAFVPVAGYLARLEPTRWGSLILGIACLVIPVLVLRLQQIASVTGA